MTFLQKYELLKKSIPVPAVSLGNYSENLQFCDMVYRSKNCVYCFDSVWLENSIYCNVAIGKYLVDCDYVVESERCYFCLTTTKSYGSTYLIDCNSCTDCHYSALCVGCSDCFGCVGLTQKKFCIFNKQYTKEEYFGKLKELKKEDPEKLFAKMLDLKKTIPHPASQQANNENCPYGDYIYNSKNVYWGFWTYAALEDCGYVYLGGWGMKDCWDMYFSGLKSEHSYELIDVSGAYNCAFITGAEKVTNCFYCDTMRNCSDCFGCVGLTNKKYCILNNQLTKEQYEKTIVKIKSELGWKT